MIPACPNNLLLMALVFWCAAYGETIDDIKINEDSDNNGTSVGDTEEAKHGPALGLYPHLNPHEETPNIQTTNDHQEGATTPTSLPPQLPPGGAGFIPGFRPPPCSGSEDSYHDGSSLPCHNTSDGGGNGTFENRTGNVNVPDVELYEYYSWDYEVDTVEFYFPEFWVVEDFLTSPVTTIVIPSIYTAVCLLSVPANICALLVFLRRIKPLNPAVIYMLNLAFSDLLFAMVLPFKIFYYFKGNDWIFGETMCRLVTTVFYWNTYCSVLLITLISVDRLLSVVYPVTSLSWRSPRKAFIACAVMWVLSFAGSMYNLFPKQTLKSKILNITICHDIHPRELFHYIYYKIYFINLCLLLFFLPLIITVVSYTCVIITLNKDKPGVPDASGRKRRAAMLTTTVLVMFVLCFTPTNLIKTFHQVIYTGGDFPVNQMYPDCLYVVYLVFLCLGSLNCILDPLVYYFGSTQFQKEVCSMLQFKKTKQGSSNQTSSGQSNPINCTNQTNTKSDCEANSKEAPPPTMTQLK